MSGGVGFILFLNILLLFFSNAYIPQQVNWVTDTQKLTDLTREMRYLTLYTDGYMDFRVSLAKFVSFQGSKYRTRAAQP